MNTDEEDEEAWSAPLEALIGWVNEHGQDYEWRTDVQSIEFHFVYQGQMYSGTATIKAPLTLTLALVLEFPNPLDELDAYRRIGRIDTEMCYGALIYNHELGLVVWRDSMFSEDAEEFDVDLVDGMIRSGLDSLLAIGKEFCHEIGNSEADARLINLPTAGRA